MLWVYGVCALCLLVCLPFFMHYKAALRYHLATAYKTMGTLCAAALALTAALRLDPVCWICFAGLMLHAAADALLEYSLYLGSGFFLAGHFCYIAFFTRLFPVSAVHLVCSVCLLALTAWLFWRWRRTIGKQMPLFGVYGFVLCLMAACAIGGLSVHTTQGLIIAVAGMLFFISDALICVRLLFSTRRSVDWAVMILYYLAQLMIGTGCLLC